MHSIQEETLRKVVIISLLFVLSLFLPQWITRLAFVVQFGGLAVDASNALDYTMLSLRFDLKTTAIWFGPSFLLLLLAFYIKNRRSALLSAAFYAVLFTASLLFNLINLFYYPISKTIVGFELFTLLKGQDATIISSYILDYVWAVILLGALALLVGVLYYYVIRSVQRKGGSKRQYSIAFLCALLLLVSARGSMSLKPLNPMDAYAALPKHMAITAMSPTYILLDSYNKQSLEEVVYVDPSELKDLQSSFYHQFEPVDTPVNVCIILLESFGMEYTGLNNELRPSRTPFLDSLMDHALVFENGFSNGLRSKDAVASIFCGMPSLMDETYIGSKYTHSDLYSLFELLGRKGYTSSFYHSADEHSMGFKDFLMYEGLDQYNAKQDYPFPEHEDGTWGVYDEPYLQWYAEQLETQPEPWISAVFTLSSHHPYTIPDAYKYLPKGSLPIHQSISYTDASLRQFFNRVKNETWFSRTLFVITADHGSENETKEFQSFSGMFRVPILLYSPSRIEPRRSQKLAQQIDIYPTIAAMTGYDSTFFALGRSLLDSASSEVIHYVGDVYAIIDTAYTLETIGFEKFSMYDLRTDRRHEHELSDSLTDQKAALELRMKAYLQDFNHRVIHNQFK